MSGFEPPPSRSPTVRSNQAELHPDWQFLVLPTLNRTLQDDAGFPIPFWGFTPEVPF